MSSGESSHPAPPPGFTVTSGANQILSIKYEAARAVVQHQGRSTKMRG
jgi:hypothetical protein